MINILASKLNFNEPWAFKKLSKYIHANHRIAVLPFSFYGDVFDNVSWRNAYTPGGKYYEEITSVFAPFGIVRENVSFINYFEDSFENTKASLICSDILFLTGGAPDLTMQRIHERNLVTTIREFDGIVMGCSAGAMVQCDQFHITPNWQYPMFYHEPGLGLLPEEYGVEVHYTPDSHHDRYIRKTIAQTHRHILILDNHSAAVFHRNQWEFIGNAAFFNTPKADEENTL